MTSVILQPVGSDVARQHFADTVDSPVRIERLSAFLAPSETDRLSEMYPGGEVPTWGVTLGTGGDHILAWERIQPGDIAVFTGGREVFASGIVTQVTRNPALARELWGESETGQTWELMYFLDSIEIRSISDIDFNEAAGYDSAFIHRRFMVLDEVRSAAVLEAYPELGSSSPVPSAAVLLRGLVGTTIQTLTGRPNRVLEVRDEDVIVGTERSPHGQPIPLEWIQSAIDELFARGEVEVEEETVGYRSSFIGAALSTISGTTVQLNPRRIRLDSRESAPTARRWREPPEVRDAKDAIDELAGRHLRRPQGRRQSATERRAIERHAIVAAVDHFRRNGWDVEDVGRFASYDLECRKGENVLHVEVKGTTSQGERVLLTRNEVFHAKRTESAVALFILARIILIKSDDSVVASGGTQIILDPWHINDGALEALAFEYTLP
jgi:hypothetical protein